jgi:hypothetical protein
MQSQSSKLASSTKRKECTAVVQARKTTQLPKRVVCRVPLSHQTFSPRLIIVGETVVERFVCLSFLTSWDSTQPLYESHGFPALVSVWKRSVVAVGGRDIITEKEFGDRRRY